jgi:CBS domain-containing protein
MKVREIMTTDPATASMDTSLEEVARMMREEDVGALPVLDDDGGLFGIVTDRDIVVRCVAEGKQPGETTVEDVLTEDLHTVNPDDDVEQAARLMSQKQIRRLPVVEEGELVGMISLGDIAAKQRDEEVAGDTLARVSEGVKRGRGEKTSASGSHGKSGSRGGGKRGAQSISNRRPQEEEERQARVAPARSQNRTTRRRRAS